MSFHLFVECRKHARRVLAQAVGMHSAGGMGLAGSILSQEVDGASVFCALCHLVFACAKEGKSFGVVMARGLIVGLPGTCCWLGHYWCACIPSGLAAHAALDLAAHAALYCGFVTSVRGRPQASETMLLAGLKVRGEACGASVSRSLPCGGASSCARYCDIAGRSLTFSQGSCLKIARVCQHTSLLLPTTL